MTKRRFAAAVLTLILLLTSVSSAFAWEIETPDATPEMYEKPENRNIPMPEGISRIYLDLPYCGENSTKTEKLHLLLPEDGEGPYPVLISVHGGGLEANNSTRNHEVSFTQKAAFAGLQHGYAVACVDYTLKTSKGPAVFPLAIQEVRAAVRYIRSVAAQYHLDPDHIALIGESAGGMLVGLLGVIGGDKKYDYDNPDFGNMEYSGDVQAVIVQYAAGRSMGNKATAQYYKVKEKKLTQEMVDAVTALNFIDANDPPYYFDHGKEDSSVPYTTSIEFYEAMTAAGVENCELHIYEGMEHAVQWFQSDYVNDRHFEWLDKVFNR